jgi:GT2 family glycosyltransferase
MRTFLAPPPETPLEGLVQPGWVPTFSIIIPAYQAASFIAGTVESALNQTVPALEVIVCDDGSTDDLQGALRPYLERITLLRQKNAGTASARNTAVRAASGDFIALLDHDDIYLPERIEALGELAAMRPDLDVLATDCYFELESQIFARCYEDSNPFPTSDQRRAILEANFVSGPVVRRTRLLDIGGFDESISVTDDWDCWIRLIFDGARVGLVAEPLHHYRFSEGSLSSSLPNLVEGRIVTLEKAAARSDLLPHERQALERMLAAQKARLAPDRAREALLLGRPDARRRSLAVTFGRGHSLPTRVKSAVAAVAPGAAARRLARRQRELRADPTRVRTLRQ